MAFLLCVANQKGGSGKTTTAINLAGGFARSDYPVLVVDADPQESAVAWASTGSGLPFQVVRGTDLGADALSSLMDGADYEVVIVDCPPGVADDHGPAGLLAQHALKLADAILVPLRPSTLDFSSTASFVAYLQTIRPDANPGQRVLVLLNALQRTTLLSRQAPLEALKLFADLPGARVLSTGIGLRIPIGEVSGTGKTIFDYAPQSEAAREYSQLTQEVLSCLSSVPLS
jgi:chromosome partitioning protein